MLLPTIILLLLVPLLCQSQTIAIDVTRSSHLLSRGLLDQLQQGIQDLGNGVQNFFGNPSSLLGQTTPEQEGVNNALGREYGVRNPPFLDSIILIMFGVYPGGQDPSPYSRVESDGLRHYYCELEEER